MPFRLLFGTCTHHTDRAEAKSRALFLSCFWFWIVNGKLEIENYITHYILHYTYPAFRRATIHEIYPHENSLMVSSICWHFRISFLIRPRFATAFALRSSGAGFMASSSKSQEKTRIRITHLPTVAPVHPGYLPLLNSFNRRSSMFACRC